MSKPVRTHGRPEQGHMTAGKHQPVWLVSSRLVFLHINKISTFDLPPAVDICSYFSCLFFSQTQTPPLNQALLSFHRPANRTIANPQRQQTKEKWHFKATDGPVVLLHVTFQTHQQKQSPCACFCNDGAVCKLFLAHSGCTLPAVFYSKSANRSGAFPVLQLALYHDCRSSAASLRLSLDILDFRWCWISLRCVFNSPLRNVSFSCNLTLFFSTQGNNKALNYFSKLFC